MNLLLFHDFNDGEDSSDSKDYNSYDNSSEKTITSGIKSQWWINKNKSDDSIMYDQDPATFQ